ncbi:MAG TPA: class I SAM-dependent methyltransferase [Burkholderiales bacterium]|nr:class I SAM-dependent methyltransferase [Burkholderiales bacterium]
MLQRQLLTAARQRLQQLPMDVVLWNGETIPAGATPASVKLTLNSSAALKTLAQPTLGNLARAYVNGELDFTGDLAEIIALAEKFVGDDPAAHTHRNWWRRGLGSDRQAISRHYDVGNDFFALWLDKNRVYSCGYFKHPEDTLDDAQIQKLDHICRKLVLKSNERFLDIGCGWGALIFRAVEGYGAKALGITLSQEQFAYVQSEIERRKLSGRCTVALTDYRELDEAQTFDKIASVGMFEHVGRKNFPVYCQKIFRLLKPGGLVMNHGITAAQPDAPGLGSGIGRFIEDYVFPGGELLHVSEVLRDMAAAGLELRDAECLRPHYAQTLWRWVRRLEQNEAKARELVGEKTYRIWRVYMAGSAHAFRRGWLSIFQLLGGRPLADGTLPLPMTRDYLYSADASDLGSVSAR